MAEVVVATLNVNFDADTTAASGVLKLEIDDREDGLNGGDTSFSPGDNVYFFMFKDDSVTLTTTVPQRTAGGITSAGSGTKSVDEYITFSNSDTASLGYPPDGAVSMEWVGSCYRLNRTTLVLNTTLPEVDGSELRMAGGIQVIGILHCTYQSTGSLWKLSGVPRDIPEVVVFAVGTVA